MAWDGVAILAILVVMALTLTWMAKSTSYILLRIAASMAWLAIGMGVLSGFIDMPMTETYTQVLGLLFIVMTVVPLLMQMVTEVEREKGGTKWKEWIRNPGGPKPKRGNAASSAYRDRLQIGTRRKRR